jgi:hypothetical protein
LGGELLLAVSPLIASAIEGVPSCQMAPGRVSHDYFTKYPPLRTPPHSCPIHKRLRSELHDAIASSRWPKCGVFLELFAGKGSISRHLKSWGFAVMSFEVKRGPQYDLLHPSVVRFIDALFAERQVACVFFGTPCTTWSNAARPAARSKEHIWGLPGLPEHRLDAVRIGNRQARLTARWIRRCVLQGVPVMLENPLTSLLWRCPCLETLFRHPAFRSAHFTMCAFGARWRKATRVAAWHLDVSSLQGKVCTSRNHICDFSCRPHLRLHGNMPSSSIAWTTAAAAYPRRLARELASLLAVTRWPACRTSVAAASH